MRLVPTFFLIALVSLSISGCNVTVEATANPQFQDAWLSSDADGENRVTSYGPEDTVRVKADLVGAASGTKVTAKLVAEKVDHPDVSPNTEIGNFEQVYDGTLNRMNFDFSNDGPMPTGDYRVDLSINADKTKSLNFQVKEAE